MISNTERGVLDVRTRSQHSITLRTLRGLSEGPVSYEKLAEAIKPVRESIALTLDRLAEKLAGKQAEKKAA